MTWVLGLAGEVGSSPIRPPGGLHLSTVFPKSFRVSSVVHVMHKRCMLETFDSIQKKNTELQSQLEAAQETKVLLSKDLQNSKSELFVKNKDLEVVKLRASFAEDLQDQVTRLNKELLLMGELQQKYQQRLVSAASTPQLRSDSQFLLHSYKEELNSSKIKLKDTTAQAEACHARLKELEDEVQNKENIVQELKNTIENIHVSYTDRIKAVEEKYVTQKKIQQVLQAEMLSVFKDHTKAMKPEMGDSNKGEGSPEVSTLAKVPSYGQMSFTDATQQWEEFERANPESQSEDQTTLESAANANAESKHTEGQLVTDCGTEHGAVPGESASGRLPDQPLTSVADSAGGKIQH